MRIAIINSKTDAAGKNIRRHLIAATGKDTNLPFKYYSHTLTFIETDDHLIYENSLDKRAESDLIIFISRHTSKHPLPVLTVHVTGNYGNAMLGGEDRKLAAASPEFMHAVLNQMAKRVPKGYKVSYEVTHHGPTDLKTPSFFVEIGSTEKEWDDENAGVAVSDSLLEVLKEKTFETINLVGFGGNHYATRETEIAMGSKGAFGHIAHTREAGVITSDIVDQMIEKSCAKAAYIDKKALKGSEIKKIEDILSKTGIPILTEGEIKEIACIPWETYLKIRKNALDIDSSCRIHIGRLRGFGNPVSIGINNALFEEAYKICEKTFSEEIFRLNLAYLTSQTGRILPIFITYEENKVQTINDLISLCVKILHKEADTAVIDDHLVIRKIRFDPVKAAGLGVPKGPFFGKLAAGFEVVVGDRIITPAMVSKSSEKFIHVPGLENYL
ncbi:MAG: D-tyrosyl-tRNA(Tyr) deacylase [Methanomicrobiaceae archaeon]|nr:D-tyrosyl-tRNA(Tyr) deacylase [Methanomicrobiaceae archaeon]